MKILSKIREARQRLSSFWAIEPSAFEDIKKVYNSFESNPKAFIENIDALGSLFDFEPKDLLTINGNEATIAIRGPLVDVQDCATSNAGCTSYEEILTAISDVELMETVETVIFDIDSPGGMVAGVDNAAIAIKGMKKKTEARVGIMAASAAYWLASQCDSIVATSATASFGSIGVVIEYWDGSRSMQERGFDKVCITSTGAPDKRRDALTDEGRRKIKSDLDEIENIFFRRVAEGRGTTVANVSANFGQGGMFLAEKSLSAGMIDKTDFLLNNNIVSVSNEKKSVESKMNLKEILSKHPEIQGEIDVLVANSVKENATKFEEDKEKFNATIEKASKYLASESYDKGVKELAIECIKGEKPIETLEAVVSHIDKMNATEESESAIEETEEIGETAPEKISSETADGSIHDEDSYKAAVNRIKKIK